MTNQLTTATSPYLQQHRHQAIAWHTWGGAAFAAARARNCPLFLSIGYSACHWCHVMSHDSFDHADVAALLNAHFVSIKIDREEHPEVDRLYMDAVLAMQGHGGWPMTIVATPDGTPFFGGTFFRRDQLLTLLRQIAAAWGKDPAALTQIGARVTETLRAAGQNAIASAIDTTLCARAIRAFQERFDPVHGGFGGAPKFPPSVPLMLLARWCGMTRDPQVLPLLTVTLDAMARGGLYDQVGGGFHRYATDAAWHVPHFEKMLYDNALLTIAYADAAAVTGAAHYVTVVREVAEYLLRDLRAPDGGFYTAEDADSDGGEGNFYTWRLTDFEAVLPPLQATEAKYWWQLTACGNWEAGKNILHLRGDVAWETVAGPGYRAVRDRLKSARDQRPRPLRDEKILTGLNGLAIAALARAAMLTGDAKYLAAAQQAATWVLRTMKHRDGLLRVWCAGDARLPACLPDYAYLIWGLLTLAQADGDARWARTAAMLQTECDERLWDTQQSGYFFAPADPLLVVRDKEWEDGALPSGNAIMAGNLATLSHLLQDPWYAQRGEIVMRGVQAAGAQFPASIAAGHCVNCDAVADPVIVAIVGAPDDPACAALVRHAQRHYRPGMVLAWGAPESLPILRDKGMINGRATAHLCRGTTCLPPVHTPEKFPEW